MKISLAQRDQLLNNSAIRLKSQSPNKFLALKKNNVKGTGQRLLRATKHELSTAQTRFESLGGQLNLVNPLATLDRGFSITRDQHNTILRRAEHSNTNDRITVTLAKGSLSCEVVEVNE